MDPCRVQPSTSARADDCAGWFFGDTPPRSATRVPKQRDQGWGPHHRPILFQPRVRVKIWL